MRIKKCIGYGMKDLKFNKSGLCDERINPLGWINYDSDIVGNDVWTLKGFLHFCKNRLDRFDYMLIEQGIKSKHPDGKNFSFNDYVRWGCSDYGIEGAILFQAPSAYDWYRSDDSIDYCEAYLNGGSPLPSFHIMDSGIYPYIGIYMNTETGERLTFNTEEYHRVKEFWFNYRSYLIKKSNKKRKAIHKELYEFNAYKLGMTPMEVIEKYYTAIPKEIEMLAKYLCIFDDETVIWKLKPAIYTYWS